VAETYNNWDTIVGQERLKENLKNALKYNKISHAYMLQGEKLSGKKLVADIFARALQCESKDGVKPCNECRSCRQAVNRNHPDIIYVGHENPNLISVNEIRTQINGDVAIKPYSSPRKIYIVDEAEKMNIQAQNALLKTLEEPPEYAVIMLLTTKSQAMLQTILSRCVVLETKPVPDDVIKRYLMRTVEIPDYRAAVCCSFAKGNVGRAVALSSNEEFDHMKSKVIDTLKNIYDMEISQIASCVKDISEEKFDKGDYLDLCVIWFRDVLLYKAIGAFGDTSHIIFKEEMADIANAASHLDYDGIERIIRSIEKARSRIAYNVNADLTLELMLMDIKAA
jgi:DNA polymerase-3 subunit delta'